MEENPPSDDFGALFGTSADLAALALAGYTIVVTVRMSSSLPSQVDHYLKQAQGLLAIATIVLLIGSLVMLLQRADLKRMRIFDFFFNFKSFYTPVFWGICLVFIGFLLFAFSGYPQ
jgi:uncharacterized membrane protein